MIRAPALRARVVALELYLSDAQAPPEEHRATIAAFLSLAGDVLDKMLNQRGLNFGDLRVTVTSEVQAAVAAEVATLGLHPDQAAQPESLGGLSGKALVDHEWVPVAVVAGWSPGPSPLSTLQVVARELGHVLVITIGTALGSSRADPATVAESDEAVALATADEYRADQFAAVLCELGFKAADVNGTPIDIWELRRDSFLSTLDELLSSVVPVVPDLVQAARAGQTDPEQAYYEARNRLHDAFNLLGYLEGTFAGDGTTISASSHPAADLLRPFWEPLFAHLCSSPSVCANDQWFDDEAEVRRIGREGIDAVYRRVGLTRTDNGNGGLSLKLTSPTWTPP